MPAGGGTPRSPPAPTANMLMRGDEWLGTFGQFQACALVACLSCCRGFPKRLRRRVLHEPLKVYDTHDGVVQKTWNSSSISTWRPRIRVIVDELITELTV